MLLPRFRLPMRRTVAPLLFAGGLLITPTAFGQQHSELPQLGDPISGLVSSEQEYELGRAWLRSLRRELPMLEDPLVRDYVRDLTYRLTPYSQLDDSRLEIVVIDSRALNAFAVPGGVIGVNAGLFLHAADEHEFASVLAHELAHLGQRHFARRLEENQKNQPLALAGLLASIVLAATTGSDAGMAALASTQAYQVQRQLDYSRENEQEADRIGLNTLAQAGMNPRAMASMFERMMRAHRYGRYVPEYLRTHPLSESRVADTRNRAERYPARNYQEDIEYYFMKSRILLAYADSPGTAAATFRDLRSSSHTHLAKAARYGLALANIKLGQLQEAEEALEPLLKEYPNRIALVLAQTELLEAQGKIPAALELLDKHYRRNPGNAPLGRAYAQLLVQQGRLEQARAILQRLILEDANDPSLWRSLGDVQGKLGDIVAVHQAQAEYHFLRGQLDAAILQLRQALKKSPENFQQQALIQKRLDDFEAARKGIKF